jgi:tripartite-type tricarboxylate transporter receptor subunit TctC
MVVGRAEKGSAMGSASCVATLFAAVMLQFAVLPAATAQQFPSRPVRAIYPFSPGGFGDVLLRAIGVELGRTLGQSVLVENRPGANTMVGAEACAKSAPDGHTVCMLTVDTLSYNPYLYKKPLYNAETDFEPITNLVFVTEGLLANPGLGINTLPELIALAKSKPGSLAYGTPANNVVLFMDAFKRDTGTDIRAIPYKGPADSVNALISGEVQVGFIGIGNVIGHVKGGRIKPLAVDGSVRSPLFPEVPTLAEAGYRGVQNRVWLGLLGPAGIPKPVVARLHTEIARIVGVPAFRDQYIIALGLEAILDTPEHFAQFIRENRSRGEALVRQSGMKPE